MVDNANGDFEFIKEQIVEKKIKKFKRYFIRFSIRFFTAVLFGVVAAVTFVLAEPTIYKIFNKERRDNSPISLPTPNDVQDIDITGIPDESEAAAKESIPETVIQKIDANLSDYKDMYYELRKVAYKVNKSVVKICSTFIVEDWFNNLVEKNIYTTGVIVAETPTNLYILVSLDRIQNADKIRLKFSDTVYVDAWITDYEEEINIAIINVSKKDIPSIYLSGLSTAILGRNYSLVVGNPVIALGSPNGHLNSMGLGIISSEGSSVAITDNILKLFNTDIDDNDEGDGVIVNMRGEVIGWITRTLKENQNKSINTAISVEYIRPYILRMINQTPRVYFGIKAKDMTEDAKQAYNVSNGIYVDEVYADSPAFKGNIKNGDIIVSVNNIKVMNTNNFFKLISQYMPGTQVEIGLVRTSGNSVKQMEITVALANKP